MNIIRRLTQLQFHTFVDNYYAYPSNQRVGQAFLNRFYNDVADPELFYETDDVKAIHIIQSDYVELEQQVANG